LANEIFSTPANELTSQYTFYVVAAAKNQLGVINGDKLLFEAAIEAILAHPSFLLQIANESLGLLGLNFKQIFINADRPIVMKDIYPYWGEYHYHWVDFNLANCASNTLPENMVKELNLSQIHTSREFNSRIVEFGSLGRNFVRAICGTILMVGFFALFLIKRRRFFNIMLLSVIIISFTVLGVFVGGVYTRYEVSTLSMIILASCIIIDGLIRYIKSICYE
jgi:hypothetical protein